MAAAPTTAQRAAERPRRQRDNGRRGRAVLGYRCTLFEPEESIADPVGYLEDRRGRYIRELERLAQDAHDSGDVSAAAALTLSLAKLSSLGRQHVSSGRDVAAMPDPALFTD